MAAVAQHGEALAFADTFLRADRQVVLVAVMQVSMALRYADESLHFDLEVNMVRAFRHATADTLLNTLFALKKRPDWEDEHAVLGHAVEMLSRFPIRTTNSSAHQQLHDVVEDMVQQAYRPGKVRDIEAFEEEINTLWSEIVVRRA